MPAFFLWNYPLSLSMGIAYCDPAALASLDDLIARADEMVYEQKRE